MGQIGKSIIAFLASVLTATVLGSIMSSQFVISALSNIGTPVSMGDRLSMTGFDIANLGPLYGAFIFIGLAIAFFAGWIVYKFAKTGRTIVYMTAGFVAMLVMLMMMKNVFFGVQLIAGARELPGLIAQGLMGGIAGYVFARLSAPRITTKPA